VCSPRLEPEIPELLHAVHATAALGAARRSGGIRGKRTLLASNQAHEHFAVERYRSICVRLPVSYQARTKSGTSTLPLVSGLTSNEQTKLTAPTTVPSSMETPNPTS
jgi:hypothetical protein